jgi:tRNA 2-thiouridine synthesizing protein A
MLSHHAYLSAMDETPTIDARGLLCPLPVLKLRKRLKPAASGARVALWADDPAAIVDVPHYCAESGHRLLSVSEAEGHQVYLIEKT